MKKLTVGVLRGGPSEEYGQSLETGRHVLTLLRDMEEKYEPKDILISQAGEWHRNGLALAPEDALLGVDVVYNALHGHYGEDGQVQGLLEELGLPFTGSYSRPSRSAFDKEEAKKIFYEAGLSVPRHELIESEPTRDQMTYIFHNYVFPVIVKPAQGGSGIGSKVAKTFHELGSAVSYALKYCKKVLVEEFVRGKEATCAVAENARGEKLYALLPLEIKSGEALSKHSFGHEVARRIEEAARQAHEALELEHYSQSDFIITPHRKVYILETNSHPKLSLDSHLTKSLHAVGWHPRHFVDHALKLALER